MGTSSEVRGDGDRRRAWVIAGAALVAAIVGTGCAGGSGGTRVTGTVTLTAVDCRDADLAIAANITVAPAAGNQFIVKIDLMVTCAGQPLPAGELRFTPWVGDSRRIPISRGTATYSIRTHADPRPTTAQVEIKATDGTHAQTITVQ